MNKASTSTLKDGYYVDNFHTLAGFVVKTYSDLLKPEELAWYESISSLSNDAQRLYIRLLMRRGSIYRLSRLHYDEISDITQAVGNLAESALASVDPPDTLELLLAAFTKPELLQLLDLGQWRTLARVPLLQHIAQSDETLRMQYLDTLQKADCWVRIAGYPYWTLMQLCFFGNLYQDSSEFVLRDLGTQRYEKYPLEPDARAFASRAQIDAHLRYFECDALFACLNRRNRGALLQLAGALPSTRSHDVHLCRRVDRLRNQIARQLERLAWQRQALNLYCLSTHPPARERRVRIHLALQQYAEADQILQQMQQQPFNEAEATVGQTLTAQCNKLQGLGATGRRLFKPASSMLVLYNSGRRVEELARLFYAGQGDCFHAENALVNGVLGLFIWDILFCPVPGAFFNPFQSAPADFHHPQFCHVRAELLMCRFEQLNDAAQLEERVLNGFELHYGKVNPLVRWHRLSPELLSLAVKRIPVEHWHALFTRILSDTRENTAGLPDLALFPAKGGYEFIEIKGPGDTLQANQRRWMEYFDQHGIHYRLVRVRYRASEPAALPVSKASH